MGRNANIAKYNWDKFKRRKSREPWRCCLCHKDIEVGKEYIDGKRFYNKAHISCLKREIRRRKNG